MSRNSRYSPLKIKRPMGGCLVGGAGVGGGGGKGFIKWRPYGRNGVHEYWKNGLKGGSTILI